MTHLRLLVMSSAVTLFLASAPLRGQATIPNTPAGQALRAFLDAFNSADSTRVAAFLSTYQVGFPFRNIFNFRQMTGGFNLLRVEVSEPRHIEFVMRHRNDPMTGYGMLEVAADNPKQINGNAFPLGPNVSVDSLRIDRATRAAVIGRAAALLDSFYYSPTVGKQLSDSLHARLARGAYNRYVAGPGLAIRLNDDLAEIAHDQHLGVRYVPTLPKPPAAEAPPAPPAPSRTDLDETNCGFKKVEQLDGNVGYVRFDSFEEAELCGSTASAALTFLAATRALIIDLRENRGGKPEMVALIASFVFDRRTHLGDLWDSWADSTHHYWTQDSVAGRLRWRQAGLRPHLRAHVLSGRGIRLRSAGPEARDRRGRDDRRRRASGIRGTFGRPLRDQHTLGECDQSHHRHELGGCRCRARR